MHNGCSGQLKFQFTPLREGRLVRLFDFVIHIRQISIHAPPRGATTHSIDNLPSRGVFQFTPLREGRPEIEKCASTSNRNFNSRPSARGDMQDTPCTTSYYFNSRPSARGDVTINCFSHRPCIISIHAPPRGATIFFSASTIRPFNFNSRPSARGDALLSAGFCKSLYFNSRPSARGD